MNAREDLSRLEASGLIQVAALQPELEYLFRHALVQEAAYASLLKQDRRALHRAAAEAILAQHPDRERELASVLALHFEHAGENARTAEYLVIRALRQPRGDRLFQPRERPRGRLARRAATACGRRRGQCFLGIQDERA